MLRPLRILGMLLLVAALGVGCGSKPVTTASSPEPTPSTPSSGATASADATESAEPPTRAGLRTAVVPRACQMPRQRLVDGKTQARFAPKQGSLLVKKAVRIDLDGDGSPELVVPFDCTAGGVGWPQLLVVYGPGERLLGHVDLGQDGRQEHAVVGALTPRGKVLTVSWTSYEGAGFDAHDRTSTLSLIGGKVAWSTTDPGAVITDYTKQHGVKVFNLDQLNRLRNLPDGFYDYLAGKLAGGKVGFTLDRTRRDGWASGGVSEIYQGEATGGYVAIWHRVGQTWKQVWGGQDVPMCAELRKLGVPPPMVIPQQCFASPDAQEPVRYR